MANKIASVALGLVLIGSFAMADAIKNPLKDGETWADLAYDVIGDAVPKNGATLFSVDVPYRAHDAAIVPVRITQDLSSDHRIDKLTIVVDENPSPLVAAFEFGPNMGHIDLETRVRVDMYSNVRVIAETADGGQWMNGRFVKASGGCSAPALKGMEAAMANAGKMRLKLFDTVGLSETLPSSSGRKQAQVMIRHPNYSGMQRNQVTNLFIPAFFVHELEVFQGDEILFRMEGGISISEDPVFRFSYTPNGAETFRIRATDTDGQVFEQVFDIEGKAT
ncbi:MAG: quinoprotein dehydrogenase-associated SoxYZ-like carrier [Paracoccaceae bacterium]